MLVPDGAGEIRSEGETGEESELRVYEFDESLFAGIVDFGER